MERIALSNGVWVLHGAVNMGLVRAPEGLIAIDTGLDKQAGKALLRAVDDIGIPLIAIVNTHAHADHFGGNAQILSRAHVRVYAPISEADVIRRPRWEPEYLWQGAVPFGALQSKFLQAEASPVDEAFAPGGVLQIGGLELKTVALPGHSAGQAGVLIDDVFFAADAYFDPDVTDKHGIPFMVNYVQTLDSAKRVLDVPAGWYVPGHGAPAANAEAAVS
ncbi:MAG: MBL fold metallo-hydrolase, partial [Alicyclobacillus sp.]|nr:MBL fold metallo-hydrolase [Alicyclobacillus sp.]